MFGKIIKKWKENIKQKKKSQLEQIKITLKKKHEQKVKLQERRKRVKEYLSKAGIPLEPQDLSKKMFKAGVFVTLAVSGYLIYFLSTSFCITWEKVALWVATVWVVGFIGILFILWIDRKSV